MARETRRYAPFPSSSAGSRVSSIQSAPPALPRQFGSSDSVSRGRHGGRPKFFFVEPKPVSGTTASGLMLSDNASAANEGAPVASANISISGGSVDDPGDKAYWKVRFPEWHAALERFDKIVHVNVWKEPFDTPTMAKSGDWISEGVQWHIKEGGGALEALGKKTRLVFITY